MDGSGSDWGGRVEKSSAIRGCERNEQGKHKCGIATNPREVRGREEGRRLAIARQTTENCKRERRIQIAREGTEKPQR